VVLAGDPHKEGVFLGAVILRTGKVEELRVNPDYARGCFVAKITKVDIDTGWRVVPPFERPWPSCGFEGEDSVRGNETGFHSRLLVSLEDLLEFAELEGAAVVMHGDLNATTHSRREGYAANSPLEQVDAQLQEWIVNMDFTEVLPPGFTWHTKDQVKRAALDHVLLRGKQLRSEEASATVHWIPETTLDHALVAVQLPREAWGPRLALHETNPEHVPRTRIRMKQWAENDDEWVVRLTAQVQLYKAVILALPTRQHPQCRVTDLSNFGRVPGGPGSISPNQGTHQHLIP